VGEPGARRVIAPGPRFTPETELFIRDAQKLSSFSGGKGDGIVSPLPLGASEIRLRPYLVFQLFRYVSLGVGDSNDVIDALTTYPYLGRLRSIIWGPAGSETVSGAPDPSGRAASF
jgi:hypothetical protein